MRLKILFLFVAIQLFSFGIWTNLSHAEPFTAQVNEVTQVHSAPTSPAIVVEQTDAEAPDLLLRFANRNMSEERRFLNAIKKNQILTALQKMPLEHAQSIESITLDYSLQANRGLGGNNQVILRGVDMGTEEMIAVLIHELGHNVDFAYLTPKNQAVKSAFVDGRTQLYKSDASVDFYAISWESAGKRKKAAVNTDFVSGYAMSDPFEDFGETYTFYVLHNKDFKKLAASSDAMYAKYLFMKYQVFDGVEFDTGDGLVEEGKRPWDVTVLNYDYSQLLS